MGKNLKVRFAPFDASVQVAPGTSLLAAVKKAGLPVKSSCGGKGTCGDCLVRILSGETKSRPSAAVADDLAGLGYVLACQTDVTDHLVVEMPQFREISIRALLDTEFIHRNGDKISGFFEISPSVRKIELNLTQPTLEDHASDLERIKRALDKKAGINEVGWEYSVLKTLAEAVRAEEGRIDVVLFRGKTTGWTVLDVASHLDAKKVCGLACDIGTTTIAVYLVDLASGEILSAASSYNQQLKCGEDVISRINFAAKPGGLDELRGLVVSTINHLIAKAAEGAGVSLSDVYFAAFAGNTTMTHLFLGIPPRYIREEPYVPTFNEAPEVAARELGLTLNPQAKVRCAPAVGSYVGGDITAGLLATPILRDASRISLFIDAGTNGEIVVGNKDWLVTCACSAGPAFEGGGMKCGMPASEGAIEELEIQEDGGVLYKTIGQGKPKGLCGSGLIDLLAELFVHGYIDKNGKFHESRLGPRLVRNGNGPGFLVEAGKNCYWGRELIITERDIANLIRTKGAVFSACSLLLKNVGLAFDRIDDIYIAGGFGQHLDIESAVRIGLLPDLPREKFHYLGNTSIWGSYLILLSERNSELVNATAKKMTYIELNAEPGYMHEYTGALFLPHTELDLFPTVQKLFAPERANPHNEH